MMKTLTVKTINNLKKILLLFVIMVLAACNHKPAQPEKAAGPDLHSKARSSATRSVPSPWIVKSYAPKPGETEGKKFVRYSSEGNFRNAAGAKGALYAEIIFDKLKAGIFLHETQKSAPARKFSSEVRITLKTSDGKVLEMTSSRIWSESGGIMIEKNNNDYSQFRIFMLQNAGTVAVEVKDSESNVYNFNITAEGFSSSFGSI
jgi:hypothetical protein